MDAWSQPSSFALHAPPLAFGTSWWEIAIILLVVLLLFGNKLPGMARNLGKSVIEFKKGVKGDQGGGDGDASLPASEKRAEIGNETRQKGSRS